MASLRRPFVYRTSPFQQQQQQQPPQSQSPSNANTSLELRDGDYETPVYLFVSNEPGASPRHLTWKLAWSVGPGSLGARNRLAWKHIQLNTVSVPVEEDEVRKKHRGGKDKGDKGTKSEEEDDDEDDHDHDHDDDKPLEETLKARTRGTRPVRYETRYAYTGSVTKAPGADVMNTSRYQLGVMTLAQRNRITVLAQEVPLPPPKSEWNGQDWIVDLLDAMVAADILERDICESAISWGKGEIGYI